jgi:hypothetical protein
MGNEKELLSDEEIIEKVAQVIYFQGVGHFSYTDKRKNNCWWTGDEKRKDAFRKIARRMFDEIPIYENAIAKLKAMGYVKWDREKVATVAGCYAFNKPWSSLSEHQKEQSLECADQLYKILGGE